MLTISSNYKGSDSDNAMPKKRPQLQILTMMEVIITMMTMMILRSRGGDQGPSHLQQLKNRPSQKSMIPEKINVIQFDKNQHSSRQKISAKYKQICAVFRKLFFHFLVQNLAEEEF